MSEDELFAQRTRALIANAVNSLDPADREARVEFCRENDQHGVRMKVDPKDGVLEFFWGGRKLAEVHREALESSDPLQVVFVAEVPDTVPAEWTEQ